MYEYYGNPDVEFSWEGYKIRKVFGSKKINILKGNYWIFSNWCSGEVSKSALLLSKSIFYVKNHRNLSEFSLKNTKLETHFCYWHFLIASIFKITLVSKMMPNFSHLAITSILKIQLLHSTTARTFLILYPSFENSATGIAILNITNSILPNF